MSHNNGPKPDLKLGLYDEVLSKANHGLISEGLDPEQYRFADLDPEDAHFAISQYLERMLSLTLSTYRGSQGIEKQRQLIENIVSTIAEHLGPEWSTQFGLHNPLQKLRAIGPTFSGSQKGGPDTPLSRSALLTGTRKDPSLSSQLTKEIESADRVDVLCSFIKWSGLRLLLESFKTLTATPHQAGPRLRFITTSYMGATDPKAIEVLAQLPNTEIKVSYDTNRTRLHAKAYIIHRDTGFGSAYVGSANISKAALTDGLEWTSKISQYELLHLWKKIIGTFDAYWNDKEFEAFDPRVPLKLRNAIQIERTRSNTGPTHFTTFDLRPFPFQQEILDILAAEREIQKKTRHLVVAATGTGKTMIAAFDYAEWSNSGRPSLLFIAHRKEILQQALGTFRAVLRDQNFGDLLVGGASPKQSDHLFCSIQSFNSKNLADLSPDRYEYIVVDEFHHAAAPSYKQLLNQFQPNVLLGLTATPERADGLDILSFFGGSASAEIRLPDAINRRLLSPFQYFGISDSQNLDGLKWQRGGYRIEDLDGIYTGNSIRARLIVDKVRETLLNPLEARGLGFCVSVAHANYMARVFAEAGIPALALSAQSSPSDRDQAKDKLVQREVNFIFVVDLYNEGVDIPQVDTVLFLRPTESLTVYLQQLGRGLRIHNEKECLTVLDFIGAQRKEFRFASRFRALSSEPTGRLEAEIEHGFPHLPAGCSIQMERIAQQNILENVRQTLILRRGRLVKDLADLGHDLLRKPSIGEALDYLDTSLAELLKRGMWSRLLSDAGQIPDFNCPDEGLLAKGLLKISHWDDPDLLRFVLERIEAPLGPLDEASQKCWGMLFVSFWGKSGLEMPLTEAHTRLISRPQALSDLKQILEFNLCHSRTLSKGHQLDGVGPLSLHAQYTRDEILVGLGHWQLNRRPDFREGTLFIKEQMIDAFFITLNKSEEAYSPTTMYEDYAISEDLFHWQSQSTTSAESPTGRRYITQRKNGSTPLFFVRENKKLPSGQASPYGFLGAGDYVSHSGSKPISFVWRLREPMPVRLLRLAVG